MTADKQIIIDGVDVSGCKHYKHNDKNSGWSGCTSKDEEHIHSVNPLCCEKKDCLYKQLKHKEQECEELKSVRDSWIFKYKQETRVNEFYKDGLDQLKAELEQEKALKETYLACYKAKHEDIEGELFNLKAENDELKKDKFFLEREVMQFDKDVKELNYFAMKLKNCLTEIKEIARVNSINTCWTAINLCVDCDEIKECGLQSPFEKLKTIIQIISEVEDA